VAARYRPARVPILEVGAPIATPVRTGGAETTLGLGSASIAGREREPVGCQPYKAPGETDAALSGA